MGEGERDREAEVCVNCMGMDNEPKPSDTVKWDPWPLIFVSIGLIATIVGVALWMFLSGQSRGTLQSIEAYGVIGDSFGFFTSGFTCISLLAIVYTLKLQRDDLNSQRRQMTDSIKELKLQTKEAERLRYEGSEPIFIDFITTDRLQGKKRTYCITFRNVGPAINEIWGQGFQGGNITVDSQVSPHLYNDIGCKVSIEFNFLNYDLVDSSKPSEKLIFRIGINYRSGAERRCQLWDFTRNGNSHKFRRTGTAHDAQRMHDKTPLSKETDF